MEAKKTKKAVKSTVKTESKKAKVLKEVKEQPIELIEEEEKHIPATIETSLERIFYSLCAIAVILLVVAVSVIVIASNNGTSSSTVEEPDSTETEYDVSMMTAINADQFVEAFNGSETKVIYIGRSTCGYCAAFLPALQQAQTDYGYTTLYLDIESVDSNGVSKITALNDWLKEYYGTTPLVVVVKDGAIQGEGWVGYSEYTDFATYLEGLGFKK